MKWFGYDNPYDYWDTVGERFVKWFGYDDNYDSWETFSTVQIKVQHL